MRPGKVAPGPISHIISQKEEGNQVSTPRAHGSSHKFEIFKTELPELINKNTGFHGFKDDRTGVKVFALLCVCLDLSIQHHRSLGYPQAELGEASEHHWLGPRPPSLTLQDV